MTAQKILSCVARTEGRFGAEHIVDVLLGADTERVRRWSHQQVSTYGLMKGMERKALTNMLYQLVDSGLLDRTEDDRPVLKLNDASWEVLRGKREVTLLQPRTKVRKTRFDETSWEGVDRGLFERLRTLRRELADGRNVPAYVLFSDATLRDMARVRPGNPASLLRVRGVGERKVADLGPQFLALIAVYCIEKGLAMDTEPESVPVPRRVSAAEKAPKPKRAKTVAFEMFEQNASIDEVAAAIERAPSTVWGYLGEFIAQHPSHLLDPWVQPETFKAIANAAAEVGKQYQKPIFDHLGGGVPYEQIRMTLARLNSNSV